MIDPEGKKSEMKRRLRLAKYPRRSGALFTDENNHNPLVLEDCADCDGRGRVCHETEESAVLDVCAGCEGLGTTTELVPFFSNDAPAREAVLDEDGWLTCPCCERRFTTRDHATWTGRRHKGCGQLITVR